MPNLNPRLDRFATVTLDLARAEADAMELLLSHGVWLRPLHGILHGLKYFIYINVIEIVLGLSRFKPECWIGMQQ